jgi:hypothetical protein
VQRLGNVTCSGALCFCSDVVRDSFTYLSKRNIKSSNLIEVKLRLTLACLPPANSRDLHFQQAREPRLGKAQVGPDLLQGVNLLLAFFAKHSIP